MTETQNDTQDTPDVDPQREILAWLVGRVEASDTDRQAALAMLDVAYPPSQAELDAAKLPADQRPAPALPGPARPVPVPGNVAIQAGDYDVPAGFKLVPVTDAPAPVPAGFQLVPTTDPEEGSQ